MRAPGTPSGDPVQGIVEQLGRSKKYGHLCEDTLLHVVDRACQGHPTAKAALKAAKRKLHQVFGAYSERVDYARIEGIVDGLDRSTPDDGVRAACREILAFHASTADRLPIVDLLYPSLFRETGRPHRVVDLACGLHPFALPWMGLDPEARYDAYDIDGRLAAPVNAFLEVLGRVPGMVCRDVLVSPPEARADMALLLQSIPCLEQQERGAGVRLLKRIRAECFVVSFPCQSLGGRAKGMAQHYEGLASRMADQLHFSVKKLAYPRETFYVLRR